MRACCLWRACEYSMRWIVEGDALDRDDVGCEVEISEAEAEQLFAAGNACVSSMVKIFFSLSWRSGSTIREQGFSLATPIRKA